MKDDLNFTDWKIPLYKIYTDDEDVNLITKIIRRGTQWAIGPEIEEFENAIKNYIGCEYCATLNSGTSALHATLLAYGFGKGDDVIVPSFSFISTANSVLFVDANPVFADIEETTFGLDPESVYSKIKKTTKAVMPMDYGGMPCKIFDIKKITDTNKLILIEDAAEALGSKINGRKIGSISDSTIFSFCGNKVLTTGEGGAIVTNSREIYEKVKSIRSHGRIDTANYFDNPTQSTYDHLGYNWRMSTMTAALGISQLLKLDKIIKMRQNNAKYVTSRIEKNSDIITPKPIDGHSHIYQMYTIRLSDERIRNELHDFLIKKGIFSKVYFNPIHLTDFYSKRFHPNHLETTERISRQVLTIPIYPNMTIEEMDYLTDAINTFFENRTSKS